MLLPKKKKKGFINASGFYGAIHIPLSWCKNGDDTKFIHLLKLDEKWQPEAQAGSKDKPIHWDWGMGDLS